MEIQLSWDIVFVAVFIIILSIAFIRPQKFTLRLLLGTYISLIVAESVAFFLEKIILPVAPTLQEWVSERAILVFTSTRLLFFVVAIILFLVRGHYHIEHKKRDHWLARSIIHLIFAILTSLLLSISFFAFLSGNSIIDAVLDGFLPNAWFDGSLLVEPMLHIFGVWLALPAVGMLIASIFTPKE
jgi:hypothetical protein